MKHLITLTIAIFVILLVNAQEKIEQKYDNGQIKEEGYLDKDNNKTGEWKEYHDDGSLWSIVNYDKGSVITKTFYVDDEWEETSKGNSSFYRVITKQDDGYYKCNDYWITGELQMLGKYRDLNLDINEGEFVWYHKNGEIKTIRNYENGKEKGEWKRFHNNGELKAIGNYKDDLKIGKWKYYDKNGKLIKTSRRGLTVDDAIEYNDKLIDVELLVIDRLNDLIDAFSTFEPSNIELALKAAKTQVDISIKALKKLGGFDGNNEFVKSCLELFKVFKSQLNDEYARQLEIYELPLDEYTTVEEAEFNELNQKIDDAYFPAFEKFSAAQEYFADFWGFDLEDD